MPTVSHTGARKAMLCGMAKETPLTAHIFLASSSELQDEREAIEIRVSREDQDWQAEGIGSHSRR